MLLLATALSLAPAARAAPPKLVVVAIVDQMRAAALERKGADPKGAFARIAKGGLVYTHARHTHAPLETCPGHAAIATGRLPPESGIPGNQWWDAARGVETSCAYDPLFGRGPGQLEVYALADGIKARQPGARAVCVSGKDRAAIMLCGKKPDAVVFYEKLTGRLGTSAYYGALPTWAEGLPAASSGTAEAFIYTAALDRLVETAAERAIADLGLGKGPATDLLSISFSATDYIGHHYGPDSDELSKQLSDVDGILARLLDALDKTGVPYLFVLTSDHGIGPSPVNPAGRASRARLIAAKELGGRVEEALDAMFPLGSGEGPWVRSVETTNVALDRRLALKKGVRLDRLRAEAARALVGASGVAAAYPASELADGAFTGRAYADILSRSWHPSRGGDVVFALDEGAEIDFRDGYAANHGQPHELDARVPLVFYGAGVRPGRVVRPVAMVDLAPTLAKILGFDFPENSAERVLPEAAP